MECSKCGKEKKLAAFATFRSRKGELRRRGICKECRGQYAHDNFDRLQEWRKGYNAANRSKNAQRSADLRARNRAVVWKFKSRPCADCGKEWPPVAMDLDHPKGNKYANISKLVSSSYSEERVLEEIKECEVVCACCHRLRTHARQENRAPRTRALPGRRATARVRIETLPDEESLGLLPTHSDASRK